MPCTVNSLFGSAGLHLGGVVQWGRRFESNCSGIYIVSLSSDPDRNVNTQKLPPISIKAVDGWIHSVPSIELDGRRNPKAGDLALRLASFWLPDENVLYIGRTTAKLSKRVNQFYNTPLGERGPHAGGHWIKTLRKISKLYVYYSECDNPKGAEEALLEYFIQCVSDQTRKCLRDPERPLPFGNLEYPPGKRKNHGICRSTM